MTDGSGRMRNGVPVDEERIWRKAMSRVVGMVVRMGGEDGLWGCERQGVWSVEN